MLFFRSEEHLRKWDQIKPDSEGGIISLENLVKLFSGKYFTKRFDKDYVSNMRNYGREFITEIRRIENMGSFWKL